MKNNQSIIVTFETVGRAWNVGTEDDSTLATVSYRDNCVFLAVREIKMLDNDTYNNLMSVVIGLLLQGQYDDKHQFQQDIEDQMAKYPDVCSIDLNELEVL